MSRTLTATLTATAAAALLALSSPAQAGCGGGFGGGFGGPVYRPVVSPVYRQIVVPKPLLLHKPLVFQKPLLIASPIPCPAPVECLEPRHCYVWVTPGESLDAICLREYGDASVWRDVARYNGVQTTLPTDRPLQLPEIQPDGRLTPSSAPAPQQPLGVSEIPAAPSA